MENSLCRSCLYFLKGAGNGISVTQSLAGRPWEPLNPWNPKKDFQIWEICQKSASWPRISGTWQNFLPISRHIVANCQFLKDSLRNQQLPPEMCPRIWKSARNLLHGPESGNLPGKSGNSAWLAGCQCVIGESGQDLPESVPERLPARNFSFCQGTICQGTICQGTT